MAISEPQEPPLWFIVDSAFTPRQQKLIEQLHSINAKIETNKLGTGIIRIPPNTGVLYLSTDDMNLTKEEFIDLRFQPFNQQFSKNMIICEGFHLIREKKQKLLAEILAELIITYHKGIIPTRNAVDSLQCLRSIARREQIRDVPPILSRVKGKAKSLSKAQEILLEGLILCGPNKTKQLIKTFKNPLEILDAITNHPDQITAIKGFGDKFIQSNQQLLNSNFFISKSPGV